MNQEWKHCQRYSSRVRYPDLYTPELDQHTIGILLDATAAIPMWPRLSNVFCMVPKMMCLLPYVIGPNTSSTHLQFGSASDKEDVLRSADVPEVITTLSMIEDHSGSLVNLTLFEVWDANNGFYKALHRLNLKNVGSLTKITLSAMDSVSVLVTQDIF